MRRLDTEPERSLGGALDGEVDRQPHRVARSRVAPQLQRALRATEGVDPNLGQPGLAAEVPVELGLDSRLAELVAEQVALLRLQLQLLRRDLADIAQQSCAATDPYG